jgi:hypothetical protein
MNLRHCTPTCILHCDRHFHRISGQRKLLTRGAIATICVISGGSGSGASGGSSDTNASGRGAGASASGTTGEEDRVSEP